MTFSGKTPFIIGICGGSGAGKTTLLRRLSDIFGEVSPSIFSMDNYYFPKSMQQLDSNGIVNFDLPTAIDEERLTADLKSLMQGKAIEVKEYFFNSPPDKNVLITIQPSAFIIVEGLFLFHYKEVFKSLDYSIFCRCGSCNTTRPKNLPRPRNTWLFSRRYSLPMGKSCFTLLRQFY